MSTMSEPHILYFHSLFQSKSHFTPDLFAIIKSWIIKMNKVNANKHHKKLKESKSDHVNLKRFR